MLSRILFSLEVLVLNILDYMPSKFVRSGRAYYLLRHKIQLRHSSVLRREADRALRASLRLEYEGALSEGYDLHVDQLLHVAKLTMVLPEEFGEEATDDTQLLNFRKFYSEYRDDIERFKSSLSKNIEIADLVCIWISAGEKTRSLYPLLRRVRKQANEYELKIREKESFRVDLKLSELPRLFTLFSALVFISGVAYNTVYLSFFHIDVKHYFEIGDYIPSIVSTLVTGLFSGAVALFFHYLGVLHGSRKSFSQHMELRKYQAESNEYTWIVIAIVLFFALGLYLAFQKKEPHLFISISYNFWLIVAIPFGAKLARYFFVNYREVTGLVLFLLIFGGSLIRNMVIEIHEVRNGVGDTETYVFFENGENRHLIPDSSVLIGSTSKYLFFWKRIEKTTVVIERAKVSSFLLSGRKKELSIDERIANPP